MPPTGLTFENCIEVQRSQGVAVSTRLRPQALGCLPRSSLVAADGRTRPARCNAAVTSYRTGSHAT